MAQIRAEAKAANMQPRLYKKLSIEQRQQRLFDVNNDFGFPLPSPPKAPVPNPRSEASYSEFRWDVPGGHIGGSIVKWLTENNLMSQGLAIGGNSQTIIDAKKVDASTHSVHNNILESPTWAHVMTR